MSLLFLSSGSSVKKVGFLLEGFFSSLFALSFGQLIEKASYTSTFCAFFEGMTVLVCVCLGGTREDFHGKLNHFLACMTA